jgi:hypothetical protein
MAPPKPLGFILVSFTGKFTNNLGLIACKLITLFLIILHVVIQTWGSFWLGFTGKFTDILEQIC